jgi:hypothetical protein
VLLHYSGNVACQTGLPAVQTPHSVSASRWQFPPCSMLLEQACTAVIRQKVQTPKQLACYTSRPSAPPRHLVDVAIDARYTVPRPMSLSEYANT